MPPLLRGPGVILHPIAEARLDALMEILASPGVREWWGLQDDLEHEREGLLNDGQAFAIEIGGSLAGWLGYNEQDDPGCRYASLDIFLAIAAWEARRSGWPHGGCSSSAGITASRSIPRAPTRAPFARMKRSAFGPSA